MLILTIRADKPEAELGLFEDRKRLASSTWQAHRELAATIHDRIQAVLDEQSKTWQDVTGIVCYKGPGSFTGLRIGHTVANTAAYALNIPVVAEPGEDWITKGVERLLNGNYDEVALPFYGAEVHITSPKK